MNSYGSSEEHQPLLWVRGYPVYAAHAIVAVYVLGMLAATIAMGSLQSVLPFSSGRVLKGEIWRIFTYGILNRPSLWFAIDMVMIAWFGRELEKYLGRAKFLLLYAAVYLAVPLVLTAVGLRRPMFLSGNTVAFPLFIAFATLYPNVTFFFNLLAKWVAAILVAIYTLMAISDRDLVGLISMWTAVTVAYAFVRYEQGHLTLPAFTSSSAEPHESAPARISRTSSSRNGLSVAEMAEVDALLDKIAQSGIHSLTAAERAKLDNAREEISRRARSR